jgi:hypothetical protein
MNLTNNQATRARGRTADAVDTYRNKAEAEADRVQQQSLLTALRGWKRGLRRDECNARCIIGTKGHILTRGDGKSWVIYIGTGWRSAKRRMANFTSVSQNGDTEGCMRLDRNPNLEEAAMIRDVIALRKRPVYSEETLAAKRTSALRARSILHPDSKAGIQAYRAFCGPKGTFPKS